MKERDRCRVGRPGELDEELDGIESLLDGGAQCAHDPALGPSPPPGPVASPDLAVDDGGPDRLLGPPVGGIDAGTGEVGEQRVDLVSEVGDQLSVLVVGMGLLAQQWHALGQVGGHPQALLLRQSPGIEASEEDLLHLSRRGPRPVGVGGQELVAPSKQVRSTRLVLGLGELSVDDPPVAHDDTGEVLVEQLFGFLEAPAVGHVVGGGSVVRHHPQPGTLASDSPTGLVGYHPWTGHPTTTHRR